MRYSLLLLGWGLLGCTSPHLSGVFHETKPRALLFVSREIRFYPGGRVAYLLHSDAIGSGQHAGGTYELRGRQLELHFTGPAPLPVVTVRPQPLPAGQDSVRLRVRGGLSDSTAKPLSFASVRLLDAAGNVLDVLGCGENGQLTLPLYRVPTPHSLQVSWLGLDGWRQPWPTTGMAYDVYLPPNFGQPIPAGTTHTYRLLRQRTNKLWLRDGTETRMFVRQPQ